MYTGGVLTKAVNSFLFNTGITSADLGGYEDSQTGLPVLILKKLGYSISGSNMSADLSCNEPGAWKALLITLNPDCPCDLCNYEYSIKVMSKHEQPGFFNSDITRRMNIYTGRLDSVSCTDGSISATQVLAMETDLISQINDYVPFNTNADMPAQYASRYYVVKDADIADASIVTVTLPDGTAVTLTSAGANNSLVQEINEHASLEGKVKAMYLSDLANDYTFAVFAIDYDYATFTVTAGTDTTIVSKSIMLLSRLKTFNISVEAHASLATVTGLNIAKITTTTGALPTVYCITFSDSTGTESYASGSSCCDTNAFAWGTKDADTSHTWVLTRDDATVKAIYAYSADDDADISWTDENSTLVVMFASKTGKWEKLSNYDVFREFSHQPNYGELAQQTWTNQPLKDTRYCKLTIKWTQGIADLVGANHLNSRSNAVVLYYPMSASCTDVFVSTDPMGASTGQADMTVVEFVDGVLDGSIFES